MSEQIVKTICEACPISCGIDAYVEDGRVIKMRDREDHLIKRLCPKGPLFLESQYHADRLLYPLRRKNGGFERISWDAALDIIAEKLQILRAEGRPEALLLHYGDAVGLRETRHIPRWFARAFGSPNYSTGAALCHFSNVIAMKLTYGKFTLPRFGDTQCAVFWGNNPHESAHPALDGYKHARRHGAKLIVIDPRKTRIAEEADIHVPLLPGTDAALALGMLNVIINEELYDKEFVRDWTVGFAELKEHVQKYTPEKMGRICRVPAQLIVDSARMFAAHAPRTAVMLVSAAEHHSHGVQTVRAVASLIAICGTFDAPGGNIYVDSLTPNEPELPQDSWKRRRMGDQEHSFYTEIVDECQPMVLLDATEQKPCPVEVFIMQGINPVLTWPNARRVREALLALPLVVVMDVFMSETAEMADLVLPAATWLERDELIDYGYYQAAPYLNMAHKAVDPPGECWPDWKLWLALAKRLGLEKYLPWNTLDEVIDFQLTGTQFNCAKLRENRKGFFYGARAERRYLKEGFRTPSGKVELYSKRLADAGLSPLPTLPPDQEKFGEVEMDPGYPFLLTTGGREMGYTHSQYHEVAKLNAISPGPFGDIHAEDAGRLGIHDGDWIEVVSPVGRAKVRARVTDELAKGVVHLPHGWPREGNANLLTDHAARDPISGYPPLKGGRCAVRPIGDH
ncbi:MAG: molybdopterin-dependent oxidoreductase [Deltaproteobacteria bacterium]|nr:molybdopterin-dependent oxidoreductase [Deltaproteobacteria bacterium]